MRMNQLKNSGFDFKLTSPNDKIALKTIADAYYDKYKVSIYKPDPNKTLLDEAEDMYRDYNQWYSPGDTEDNEESKFSEIPRKYYTLGDQKGYDPTLVIKYLDGTSEKIDLTDTIFEVYVDDNGITHYSHSSRMLCTNKIDSIKEISLGNGVILELGY
jgi:hypothetical protein